LPTLASMLPLSQTLCGVLINIILIATVWAGVWFTSQINAVFIFGLLLSTLLFFILQLANISIDFLSRREWAFLFLAIPTFIGAYYYHSVLPTLSTYLNRNPAKICKTIIIGSFGIFCFYSLWQLLLIGIIPQSKLWKALTVTSITQQGLDLYQGSSLLADIYNYISITSLITTLLVGAAILVDVFADLWHIPLTGRRGYKRLLFCLLIFVPGTLLSYFDWILAEDVLSGWLEIFFVGILPIWLAWKARYSHKLPTPRLLPGGRITLILFGICTFLLYYVLGANILWTTNV